MIENVLDYMADKGEYASSQREQELVEKGIAQYLLENGIGENESGEYYKKYVTHHLDIIDASDLKLYFMNYLIISDVNQVVIEYRNDGEIPDKRKNDLYQMMEKLHSCGLGEKYIPIIEVKQIIGKYS